MAIAVLRAATYERARGLWGWAASISAVFTVIGAFFRVGTSVYLLMIPPEMADEAKWLNFADAVRAENAELPAKMSHGRTLTAKTVDTEARAVTYAFDVATASIKDPAAYGKLQMQEERGKCAEHMFDFGAGARLIKHVHKAKDGTTAQFQMSPEDCANPASAAALGNKNTAAGKPPAPAEPDPAVKAVPPPKASGPAPIAAIPKKQKVQAPPKTPPMSELDKIRKAITAGGKDEDIKAATKKLRRLALKGDTAAQVYLGDLHMRGTAVSHNFSLAANWYRDATGDEDGEAQYKLALLYRDGLGVVRSQKTAREWLIEAAKNGHGKARQLLLEWGVDLPALNPIAPMKPPDENKDKADEKAEK